MGKSDPGLDRVGEAEVREIGKVIQGIQNELENGEAEFRDWHQVSENVKKILRSEDITPRIDYSAIGDSFWRWSQEVMVSLENLFPKDFEDWIFPSKFYEFFKGMDNGLVFEDSGFDNFKNYESHPVNNSGDQKPEFVAKNPKEQELLELLKADLMGSNRKLAS